MAQRRITTPLVRDLAPGAFAWDDQIRGLGVRATKTGSKSFVMQYRNALSKQRVMVLGRCNDWSVTAIRKHATEVRRNIDRGDDPLAEKDERRHSDLMSEIFDTYWTDHCVKKNKASTQRLNEETLDSLIRPHFDKVRLPEMTRKRITDWHDDLLTTSTAHRANAALAVVKKVFSLLGSYRARHQSCQAGEAARHEGCDKAQTASAYV